MPATDDEIREKYLERAIRELNSLTREIQNCELCPRGNLMPVLGSGHPQADIVLLKYAPVPSEIEEGVAFYGRAGSALMKSFKRLGIDPLAVYGTVFVKCPVADTELSAPECRARVLQELAILQPRIVARIAGLIEDEVRAGNYEPPVEPATLGYAIVRLAEAFLFNDAAAGMRGDVDRLREVEAAILGVLV